MDPSPEQVFEELTSLVARIRRSAASSASEADLAALETLAQAAADHGRRLHERLDAMTDALATAQQLLAEVSVRDGLTGLHNRRGFLEQAGLAAQLADRTRRPLALFYVGVDDMKAVNDRHGHAAGDELLAEMAAILRATFRATDVLGRLGGDEFAALAIECADEASAIGLLQRLYDAITERNAREGVGVPLAASAGLTFYDPARGRRYLESLLAESDQRMYIAKQSRRGR
ncbi:MAG: GGDEF domain-containing protein [Deltaproteobacteria bacterium]|nr:GGDEF domain-containing protein [Kofleriaceae bacterium]